MHVVLAAVAVIVALAISVMLVYYLVRVIGALRSITEKLSVTRVLLLTVAKQTEPVDSLVGGIGGNVKGLDEMVTGVGRSLGLIGGAR